MSSQFRPLSPEQETECVIAESAAVALDRMDRSDGLVRAEELPPAADFLAHIFPPEGSAEDSSPNADANPTPAPTMEAHAPETAEVDPVATAHAETRVEVSPDATNQPGESMVLTESETPGHRARQDRTKVLSFKVVKALAKNLLSGRSGGRKRSKANRAHPAEMTALQASPPGFEQQAMVPESAPEPEMPETKGILTQLESSGKIGPEALIVGEPISQATPPPLARETLDYDFDTVLAEAPAADRILTGVGESSPENVHPARVHRPIPNASAESSAESGTEFSSQNSSTSALAEGNDTGPAIESSSAFECPPQAAFEGKTEWKRDEEVDADTKDDDAAIASAIDRYANLRAPREYPTEGALVGQPRPQGEVELASEEPAIIRSEALVNLDRQPGDLMPGDVVSEILAEDNALPQEAQVSQAAAESRTNASPAPEQNSTECCEDNPKIPVMPYHDWSMEEKLASHREWIESKGATGKKADLSGAELEGNELIGVNLRFADLHDANLRASDLLMADLRDACLVRTNFRDSCLVGANLEGANLQGAALDTAMGLVPRQLAGANLHEASLPQQIAAFEASREFHTASQTVYRFFLAMTSVNLLGWLIVWRTKDIQLLANLSVLGFLHSPTASAILPTVQFYLIAPFALFILYLVFHFHLQHLWEQALELPAVFPDGRTLGENEPRIVTGLLHSHFRWMNQDAASTRFVEKALALLLAYWIAPVTLLLFWLRFLTLQDIHGTIFHELLATAAIAVAVYSTTRVVGSTGSWSVQESIAERVARVFRGANPITVALTALGLLTFLAAGTMLGVPHGKERAPQYMAGSIRRWAPSLLWAAGAEPYADVTEAVISTKPRDWNGADSQVPAVTGARLNNVNFRYAQAYGVFLANAHLWRANFQGAFLSQADLRDADLGQSNLRLAVLDQAHMNHANLDRASLDGANLSRADLRTANLSYASMMGAALVDARLDGATLYGARLTSATLIRTNFEKADLRESHLEGANLEHADLQGTYLWSAKLPGAHLNNAQLGTAIFIDADLRGADLRWAQLAGTVLTGADLSGAILDGADLRGAVGFGANQICAAKSRQGILLDDSMQNQVTTQCGVAH